MCCAGACRGCNCSATTPVTTLSLLLSHTNPSKPSPLAPPACAQTLESFPLPDYSAISSSASVGTVPDPLFGSVLQCSEGDSDMVGGGGGWEGAHTQ